MKGSLTRSLTFLLTAVLFCTAIFSTPLDAVAEVTPQQLKRANAKLASLLNNQELSLTQKLDLSLAQYTTMGACIVILKNGKITFTHCYGTRNADGALVTPLTAFQVGSISKMVSNIGLMKLIEQNNISLEADIGTLLGFAIRNPANTNTPITLRQLMSHTASLRDTNRYQASLERTPTPLDKLVGSKQLSSAFYRTYAPGEKRKYSNLGGGLIGSLIEKLSGQTLDAYMNEHIFAPLQITAGYQAALLPNDMPLADMYHMPKGKLAKALNPASVPYTTPDPLTHYTQTAGKLIITAPDLAKLLILLCDGGIYQNTRLLKQSTVSQITTRQNKIGSVTCDTDNGLFLNIITDDQVQGRTLYGHGGKANGMLCAAYFDPTTRSGVVLLTNGTNNKPMHNGVGLLGRDILSICYQELLTHSTTSPFIVE